MARAVAGAVLVVFAGALASGGDVFYSQLDYESGYGFFDQAFEAPFATYDSEGADDFEVSAASGWDLTSIHTPGVQVNHGDGPPYYVSHFFYADAGGKPGAVIDGCDFPANLSFTHDQGNITADLEGCHLDSGAKWFSQQVRQDWILFGQHLWATRWFASGMSAVWRNPENAFGFGCYDWKPATECGMVGSDFLFELRGQSADPDPVPALGPFGAASIVLALGAAASYLLRRKSSQ